MKKKKRLLCVLLALALIIGGVCWWQRDNIRALRMSRSMSQDELSDKMTEQQERTEEAARQSGVNVRNLTDEEKEELRDSSVSRGELIDRIAGSDAAASDGDTSSPAQQEPEDSEKALRDQLAKYIAEIYVMEAEYTGWLEQAEQAAIDEYVALPAEQQTSGNKYNIGMKYLSEALKKEKECDAKMTEIEDSIRAVLKQLGEDTSLADEIHSAYVEEKAAKKAYYLSQHS